MLSSLAAISGILAAAPAPAPRAPVAAVEISFVTHAGEGAVGAKRFGRDGCYQTESSGSTGGADYAHDSQAGCHRPADVAPVFARLGAISADALVPEREGGGHGSPARGAPAQGLRPGGSETQVVLVRADGSRWVAAKQTTADDILRAVNDLPSENQWYAQPPSPPIGKGPQLLTLSLAAAGHRSRRLEASLVGDGHWWCHRTVVGRPGDERRLPAKSAPPVTDAPARLGRILGGIRPDAGEEEGAAGDKLPDGAQASVEVAWPGKPRATLRPWRMARTVFVRFGQEMAALSPACEL